MAEVRRSRKGTTSGLISLGLFTGAGILLLSGQYQATRPSVLMVILGVLLLLWAGVLAQTLRRPMLMSAGPEGVSVRRLLGYTTWAWKDLAFANFDGSDRAVVLGGFVSGNLRYAAFAKRGARLEDLPAMKAVFARHRPDLPETMVMPGAGPAPTEETAE